MVANKACCNLTYKLSHLQKRQPCRNAGAQSLSSKAIVFGYEGWTAEGRIGNYSAGEWCYMFTDEIQDNDSVDEEWLALIMKARDLGLTKEQIRSFLYKKSKLVYYSLLGTEVVGKHE